MKNNSTTVTVVSAVAYVLVAIFSDTCSIACYSTGLNQFLQKKTISVIKWSVMCYYPQRALKWQCRNFQLFFELKAFDVIHCTVLLYSLPVLSLPAVLMVIDVCSENIDLDSTACCY